MKDLEESKKIVKIRTKDIELDENVTFADLQLSKLVLAGLKKSGFYKPSPIQLKAIPLGKLGLDLIVQAKSGTGKTCVFSVIALEHILTSGSKALQALILAPTREVAIQICGVVKAIGSDFCKAAAFIGGTSLQEDKAKLKSCQIAVGTPGRIHHLISENLLHTGNVRLFILDEADKLLAPDFQEAIKLKYQQQKRADSLCKALSAKGWPSIFISGHIEQSERNKAIAQLKDFKCRILVSTDLTSRGIDAENVDLVVCMDVPSDAETYLHRIGRAGRYGSQGIAVSFVCEKEEAALFESIIDTYHLKIQQFNEDLDDIVSKRNEASEQSWLDDVTVQRVSISRSELDRSLLEYEKHRNVKKPKVDLKSEREENLKNVKHLHLMKIVNSKSLIDELEESLAKFLIGEEKTSQNLSDIQNEYLKIDSRQFQISTDEVVKLKDEFNEILNKKKAQMKKADLKESKAKRDPVVSLANIYKWQPVENVNEPKIEQIEEASSQFSPNDRTKIKTREDKEDEEEDDEKNQTSIYYSLYSFYYNYYFSNYLKQALNE